MSNQQYLKQRLASLMIKKHKESCNDEINLEDQKIMDSFQAKSANSKSIDLDAVKSDIYEDLINVDPKNNFKFFTEDINSYLWGIKPSKIKSDKIKYSELENKKVYILEDSFLRSTLPFLQSLQSENNEYVRSCGYMIDDLSHYVDATRPSRIEQVINSDLEISEEQKQRAKSLIKKIIDNKITKYNHQPICEPNIGREGVKKVLVIDQSYNDYSIIKGMANDQTFEDMLHSAIKDNPDADIIIKTHPDAIGELSLKPKCYYQSIESKDNVYRLTDPINPISLIEYSDKVYVCSSQFGFEALMCGKEVNVFGMPFYAGWGLTNDAQKCERRTTVRTVEEIFYIAYIMFSMYIDIKTNQPCEIEDAIDNLINLRSQYFKEMKND